MWQYQKTDELYHYGILGMKWGRRKGASQLGYNSTSIRSAIAKKQNARIDSNFKNWNENDKKRDNAIELGKKATAAKRAYDSNRSDTTLKAEYKKANKDYKKSLSENTTYRKGVVRKEVGQDASRKYLSEAKKIKKQLDLDPNNKNLKRQYSDLMSKHDVERASARRAVDVSTKRMNKIRSMKTMATKAVKGVAISAAVGVGLAAANKYLLKGRIKLDSQQVIDFAKKAKDYLGYIY